MAKSDSPDDAILAALRKAVGALPEKLLMTGTTGLFPGGAKGVPLVKSAIEQEYLTSKEEKIGKGKAKVYGVITEKGIRRVVEADSPKAALESLLPAVQALGKQPDPPNAEAIRADLARATETCVSAIKESFATLESTVLKALAPTSAPGVSPGTILSAIHQALQRVEAPKVPAVVTTPTNPTPSPALPTVPTAAAVEDAIVAFVNSWVKEKTVGCQFDVLWNHLKERNHNLTIGAFQDALRKLHDANRIRLGGWARMIDDIPEPKLALFVSNKVMYYAQPANPHG